MKRVAVSLAVVLVLVSSGVILPANAAGDIVFGPETFEVAWWRLHFSVHSFRCDEAGEGVLTVTKATSARTLQHGFLLVGRDLVGLWKFFHSSDMQLIRSVHLRKRNHLVVFLLGRPGERLEITLKREPSFPPPVISFGVLPSAVVQGEKAVLHWQVENADAVVIDNGVGAVEAEGAVSVSPEDDVNYTLTATGPGGTVSRSVLLTVTLPSPRVSLTAEPSTIRVGEAATLAWNAEHADACEIQPDIGTVSPAGSVSVSPSQTTAYRIIAANEDGASSAEALVTVLQPPEIEITAAPPSIFRGEAATLSWAVVNADSVTIDPEIGPVALTGEISVSPLETTDYVFTATGPWGAIEESIPVRVIDPPDDTMLGRMPDEQAGAAGLAGETVRLINGNAMHRRLDAGFASPHHLGLAFVALYNSRSSEVFGAMGMGWSHTYTARLDPNFSIDERAVVRIVDETGRALYFLPAGDGSFYALFEEKSRLGLVDGFYVWRRRNGMQYGFSPSGTLEWIDDAVGNRLTVSCDDQGRPAAVVDAATGRALGFSYNTAGQLEAVTGPITENVPPGVYATFGYDGGGNPVSVTYADGSGFDYVYEGSGDTHNLTGVTDKLGHLVAGWTYDASDRCISHTSPDDSDVAVDYSQENRIGVTDAYDTRRTYVVETIRGHHRVTALEGPAAAPYAPSSPVRWVFDEALNLSEVETAAGAIHRFQGHDSRGNPATITLAAGTAEERTIAFTWHPDMAVPLTRTEESLIGAGTKATVWDFDDDGDEIANETPTALARRIVEEGYTLDLSGSVEGYTYVTALTYNATGQPLRIDGPLAGSADTSTFAYDPVTHDLLTVTRPLVGATTFAGYDVAGRPTTITDVNGRTETLDYDALGRVLTVTHTADGTSAGRDYDQAGRVTTSVDEDGIRRTYDYEPVYGRLFRITDHRENFIEHDYDAQGNLVQKAWFDPDGVRSSFRRWSYHHPDLPGKLYQQINPDDTFTEFDYDAAGCLTSVTDAEGNTTTYAYDALDRVIAAVQPGSVTTAFGYDAHGNCDSVTDPEGHQTTYTFDDMGRVVRRVSPDSGTTAYTYDAMGNPVRKMDAAGTVTTYAHDVLGRLTNVSFADSAENIVFSYDAGADGMGRRTGMIDPSGTAVFSYDNRGRLTGKRYTIDGIGYSLGREFTPAGRISSVSYPSGRSVDYDRSGCTCSVSGVSTTFSGATTTLVSGLSYRPFGAAQGMTAGSGIVANQHDGAGRLTAANPGAPMERTYSYDNVGNLLTVDSPGDPGYNRTYTYDDLYRLTSAVLPWETVFFTYDDNGNRLTRTIDAATETYEYVQGTNRLDSVTETNTAYYAYDAAGKITGIDDRTLIYNDSDRLVRVEENGTTLGEYVYNGLGQRVKKIVDGETTIFHWDLDDNIIAESDEAGTFSREYLYRNRGRLAMVDVATGKIYYYLNDFLGTPLMISDETGLVVWEGRYRPFGQATVNSNSTVENNFRFPGQYFDTESGLHYNYHRYYDPSIGRYLRGDPIGLRGGINLFAYVQNNPVNFLDPMGLEILGPGMINSFVPENTLHYQNTNISGSILFTDYSTQLHSSDNSFFPSTRTDLSVSTSLIGGGAQFVFTASDISNWNAFGKTSMTIGLGRYFGVSIYPATSQVSLNFGLGVAPLVSFSTKVDTVDHHCD